MCLLIHKPAGKKVSDTRFELAFQNNEDGIGVAYVCPKTNDLVVDKGYMDLESFIKFYKENNLEDVDCMIHFRAASPGMTVTPDMCHPFEIRSAACFQIEGTEDPKYAFAVGHNGKLPWRDTKKESDTALFVKEMIAPIVDRDPYFFDHEQGRLLMEKFVGDANKLCVYRFDREKKKLKVYLVNEKGGVGMRQAHWDTGCWYSNDSYKSGWAAVMGSATNVNYAGAYSNNWDGYDAANWNYRPKFNPKMGNFGVPDDVGWKWDFMKHKWVNKFTNVECDVLTGRRMPFYMRKYDTFEEKKATPKKKQELIVLEGGVKDSQANRLSASQQQSGSGKSKPDLTYLTESEARMIRRFCYEHMKLFCGGGKTKDRKSLVENMKLKDMMNFVRSELKHHMPAAFGGLTPEESDIKLVMHIKNGCTTVEDVILDELKAN